MNKELYLNKLKEILQENLVSYDDIDQIIEDYNDLYTQGLEQGLTDEEIVKKLGDARFVYKSLKDDLSYNYKTSKATGVMVFVSLILFFLSGQLLTGWQYSWMFLLLIPITGILTSVKGREILPALAVFISIIVFYTLGMKFGLWHPGWLVFLSIPTLGIFASKNNKKLLLSLTPFITVLIYFIVSYFYNEFYLYGWPIFLLIPLVDSFNIEKTFDRYAMLLSLVLSIIAYYILSILFTNWYYPLFVFVIPIGFAIMTERLRITVNIGLDKKRNIFVVISTLFVVTAYLLVSFLTKGWSWSWIILLLIPMLGVYAGNGFNNIVAYSPFVALILFFIVGRFIDGGFQYSWLFFFIIPISGILFEDKGLVNIVKKDNTDEDEENIDNIN